MDHPRTSKFFVTQTVTDIDQIKNYLKQTKPANERPQNTERIDYY